MGAVRLLVVVVVVEVLPAVAKAVTGSSGRKVLNIRIDGSNQLVGASRSSTKGPVDRVWCDLPNQSIQGFPELPIGIESIHQAFHLGISLAEVRINASTMFCPITIDGAVEQVNSD